MSRHHKVRELLGRDELDELETFAREPARTVDECHDWLLAKGYTISRGAVGNWKREFDATDKFRASNEVARALVDTAKTGGTVALADAANLKLGQLIFEAMLKAQNDEDVSTKDLWALSMAVKNVVQGQRHVEQLRKDVAAAIAEAEKDAKAGGSAEGVVSKVRQILGIKDAA